MSVSLHIILRRLGDNFFSNFVAVLQAIRLEGIFSLLYNEYLSVVIFRLILRDASKVIRLEGMFSSDVSASLLIICRLILGDVNFVLFKVISFKGMSASVDLSDEISLLLVTLLEACLLFVTLLVSCLLLLLGRRGQRVCVSVCTLASRCGRGGAGGRRPSLYLPMQ